MKDYLKLPLSEYEKITSLVDEMRKRTKQMIIDGPGDKNYLDNKLLYISNTLFECTHNFDDGKPYLHSDPE